MVVRSRVSIAALASLALGAAVLAPIPAQAGDAGTIVIALEAPLTGSQAANGQDMLRERNSRPRRSTRGAAYSVARSRSSVSTTRPIQA